MKSLLTIWTSPKFTFEELKKDYSLKWLWILMGIFALSYFFYYVEFRDSPNILGRKSSFFSFIVIASRICIIFFTAILLNLLNLFVRGSGDYQKFLYVAIFAALPRVLEDAIASCFYLIWQIQPIFNLSIFLGGELTFLKLVLMSISPGVIWEWTLLIIGSYPFLKIGQKKTAILFISVWLVFILLTSYYNFIQLNKL